MCPVHIMSYNVFFLFLKPATNCEISVFIWVYLQCWRIYRLCRDNIYCILHHSISKRTVSACAATVINIEANDLTVIKVVSHVKWNLQRRGGREKLQSNPKKKEVNLRGHFCTDVWWCCTMHHFTRTYQVVKSGIMGP